MRISYWRSDVCSSDLLETLKLAESWQPAEAPQRLYGVWFDRAGSRALLQAQTHAAGFDPDGQQREIDALPASFAAGAGDKGAVIQATGPGVFSAKLKCVVNEMRCEETVYPTGC